MATTATRLLPATHRSASGFNIPPPVISLTSAGQGSTQPVSGTSAYHYNGTIYVAYIASSGDVQIVTVNDASGSVSAPFTLHAAFEEDWHDTPSVLVRSDGHIVVAYCKHDGAAMYRRISTNAEDIAAWGTETDLNTQLGGGADYTYPSLVQLTGESSSPVYLWYRQFTGGGGTATWCLAKSTDGGSSFATALVVYSRTSPSGFAYAHLDSDGDTRIDFAVTNGTGSGDHASVYHFYRSGTSYYKSDGTLISSSLPLAYTDFTQVYDGSSTGVRYVSAIKQNSGSPIVTFPDVPASGPNVYYWCSWSGSAWSCHSPADDGTTGTAWVEGGFALDLTDPTYSYLSRSSGGHYSVGRYRTINSGISFTSSLLATSPSDDFYPVAIRNARSRKVVWVRGTASAYTSYSLALMCA